MVAKINRLLRLGPVLLLCTSFFAQSNMTVYPMSVSINSQGEGSVRVISKTNEVQYIKATVFRIDNPSTPQEKEIEVTSGDANQLVIMPPKFALLAVVAKPCVLWQWNLSKKKKTIGLNLKLYPALMMQQIIKRSLHAING